MCSVLHCNLTHSGAGQCCSYPLLAAPHSRGEDSSKNVIFRQHFGSSRSCLCVSGGEQHSAAPLQGERQRVVLLERLLLINLSNGVKVPSEGGISTLQPLRKAVKWGNIREFWWYLCSL